MTSANTTAEDAKYRGPSSCRVREYRMVSTREVVWNTSTPRDRYFSREEAMSTGNLATERIKSNSVSMYSIYVSKYGNTQHCILVKGKIQRGLNSLQKSRAEKSPLTFH